MRVPALAAEEADGEPACLFPIHDHITTLELSSGAFVTARGRVYGPAGAPAVIVLGGISAHRFLLGDHAERTSWWPGIAGPGLALDPLRHQLLAFDFLADEVRPFPRVEDQAEALLALADAAGFDTFQIVGASYGGTIALALAALAPDRVTGLHVLCAAHRPHTMTTALRAIQRDIVEFGLARGDGAGGVDLARRLAMTTYRTPEEFQSRFADPAPGSPDAAGVEAYLAARGGDYAARTSPQRFLALSRSMDAARIDPSAIRAPLRLLALKEDRLVPLADIEALAACVPGAQLVRASSLYGHDGFLKEREAVSRFLEGL
ncbi:homoserine O-acetyltransferase [Glycocaulis alkaliphilus]|uniref:Homoserine O-acetyltransferase n=1 Tax=Glycocaulis alkaliphilus TaxID=1434191 RepID=A0A3T0E6P1_9PROT|nr:homoserine O-succinyltransferase [Glycocaulis alkaliphilus]AZU03075.1 homoserine O-acetyltransferase [Glycocaulis alkaliphilus]GGB70792.1 homoserine O-acetyltransferase [Glycocaulis alkaliphilus]